MSENATDTTPDPVTLLQDAAQAVCLLQARNVELSAEVERLRRECAQQVQYGQEAAKLHRLEVEQLTLRADAVASLAARLEAGFSADIEAAVNAERGRCASIVRNIVSGTVAGWVSLSKYGQRAADAILFPAEEG